MLDEKTAWTVAAGGAAFLGAVTARKTLEMTWKLFMDSDPPRNPADPLVTWKEAILWTALTGACMGLGRMLAERLATSGWERMTGRMPPY